MNGGTFRDGADCTFQRGMNWGKAMGGIIYLIGLIVVILAVLSFLGLR